MIFDPLYLMLMIPVMLLAGWAQMRVKSAYGEMSQVPNAAGMTGAEAAARMLHAARVPGARIEMTEGTLSDHYDPRDRTLRLSPDVYSGRSLASLGIACHEAGHAIQHAAAYGPLVIRNAAVPLANFGGGLGMWMVILGLMLNMAGLMLFGLITFAGVVFFQLVNLPVEFDASNRAKAWLAETGILEGPSERSGVAKVLNAAAWTYVAATLTAVVQLLYFLMLFLNRRD
jgi:Zn-dependent membrane protease YugP